MKTMKMLSVVGAVAALAFMSTSSEAAMRLCSGGKTGNYFYSASVIQSMAKGVLDIEVVETQGSMDNLKRLTNGQCDAAIVQSDAQLVFAQENPGNALSVEPLAALYPEYAHLVCTKELGIDSITDLKPTNKVLVGGLGSGSYVTWKSFAMANKERYGKIETGNDTGAVALLKLKNGRDAQCMMFVTGLNSGTIKELDKNSAGKLTLVEIDDGRFDNAVDSRGEKVYKFSKIPATAYPNLSNGSWGDWDTITVDATVVVNTDWINNNQSDYGTFADAVVASQNAITNHVSGNK